MTHVRLVFFGTGEFAVPALGRLADRVVLAVTQPDRPSGRGMSLKPGPVKLAAMRLGIPVESPEKARAPEFVERVRNERADALIVASYGQILSQALLDSATRGGINLHGSVLPKYRGAAPIQRAILEGETETGVTLMQMDKGMDSGDIIEVARTRIGADEVYGALQDRLAILAAGLIEAWIERIAAGNYPRTPQNHGLATLAPKVTKDEAELRFERPAAAEYNRFRAFTPNPGPFVKVDGALLKLHQVSPHADSGEPGTLLAINPLPLIAFQTGSLAIVEVQPEGKKRMSGRDWVNGMRLRPGHRLRNG